MLHQIINDEKYSQEQHSLPCENTEQLLRKEND